MELAHRLSISQCAAAVVVVIVICSPSNTERHSYTNITIVPVCERVYIINLIDVYLSVCVYLYLLFIFCRVNDKFFVPIMQRQTALGLICSHMWHKVFPDKRPVQPTVSILRLPPPHV